jgi:hypothetical protein
MDNAGDSGIGRDGDLNRYLASVAPDLKVPDKKESDPVIGKDYSDPPKIAVTADEGTHFLYMAFGQWSSGYAIQTDLDKLIDKLFPTVDRNPFDVVLLSKDNGQVIFQRPSSGLTVTRIDSLDKAPENIKKGNPPGQLTVKSLSQASSREEVTLEGAPYWLYSQPLKISFATADPRKDPKAATNTSQGIPEPWVLCGLIRADHFRSQSQAISYKYILWLTGSILMAIALYPFLRLCLSHCEERLRASHIITMAISTCFIAATVTFALLDICYWWRDFGPRSDEHMKNLALAIDKNFGRERELALTQLSDFYNESRDAKSELGIGLHNAETQFVKHSPHAKLTTKGGDCKPRWSCRASILADSKGADLVERYPYLDYVGWSDFNGDQRVKWTTKKSVTPFLNLDDPSILYYPAVKSALRNQRAGSVPTEGVGEHTSPNTGSNVTVFWKLFGANVEKGGTIDPADEKKVFCASMITNPISVFHAILPEGFQFAIIKPDGSVVFHSETTLNLRENLFAETDQDSHLLSRVSMRDEGPLVASYMGRPHRMYVLPMRNSPDGLWSIVIFRNLHAEETMNLEMLSLASMMFCFYALIIAIVLLLMWCVRRKKVIGTWLRPDWRKGAFYNWLLIVNILAAILLVVTATRLPPGTQIFIIVLTSVGTLVLNLFVLRRDGNSQVQESLSGYAPLAYVGVCTTLLIVIVVPACLTFFKVACDFQNKLFIGSTQMSLAADFDARAEYVRSHYQGVKMRPEYAARLMRSPEDQHWHSEPVNDVGPIVFSYHEVLGTSIDSSMEEPPLRVEALLNKITPPFNPLAAKEHHLAEAGSDARLWSSTPSLDRVNLSVPRNFLVLGGRTISSPWRPLSLLPGDRRTRLLTVVFAGAYLAVFFWLVYLTLHKLFLLDLTVPTPETSSGGESESASVTTPNNLLAIGSLPSAAIAKLRESEDVRFLDGCQKPDGSVGTAAFRTAVDQIAPDDRPLILRMADHALDDRDSSRKIRLALEKAFAKMSKGVLLISQVDPAAKTVAGESEHWQTLLSDFARLDLKSGFASRNGGVAEKFDFRIEASPYQCWRFYSLTRCQRLLLVQLAQEGVVNPHCREIVCELLNQGLIERRWGTLAVSDPEFAAFLKSIAPSVVKDQETGGDATNSSSLRISLWVVCIGLAGFLIFTQREMFNVWVTYASGIAAAVPAILKALSVFRGKGGAEA